MKRAAGWSILLLWGLLWAGGAVRATVPGVPRVQGAAGGTPLPVDASAGPSGTPGDSVSPPGAIPQGQSFLQVKDASNWVQWKTVNASSGQLASLVAGVGLLAKDTTVNQMLPLHMPDDPTQDAQAAPNALYTQNLPLLYHGNSKWDNHRNASAANEATFSGLGAAQVAPPGNWAIQNTPAVTVQATVTRAAGAAGVRHVCTSISAFLDSSALLAAVTNQNVVLRDGATGAGTILWQGLLSLPVTAGAESQLSISNLSIVGSAATAMTLEFTAGGGATTLESVSLTGYDAPN